MVNRPRIVQNCRWLPVLALTAGLYAQTPDNLRTEWQAEPLAIQTSQPRFSWIISTDAPGARAISQIAYRVIVSSNRSLLGKRVADLWDSGKVPSSQTLDVLYEGKELTSSVACYWAVASWDQNGAVHWSKLSSFRTGLLSPEDWSATWITAAASPEVPPSLPLLRREFRLNKPVARAMAYVSGLGQYELHLNGVKLGKSELAPGWTGYRKRVLYNTFDITESLNKGSNVFGVLLGNGMYNVAETKDRYTKFTGSMGVPKLIFQAQIRFVDGTGLRIVSDHTWRTVQGPITFSSTYGGEDYDARLEQAGWDRPGFEEKDWLEAQETEGPGGRLWAQQNPPIELAQTFEPVKVTQPKPGITVYDLGQNFAGWPQISLKGPRGSAVKLIGGELLDRDGLASQRSSGGPQWYSYTLSGAGVEIWHPRFSYWGFRYLQVELQPELGVMPEVLSLQGKSLHAALALAGSFQSSNDLLNRTHALIHAAMESNLQSILTDCPHREKLGWLEESHLIGAALMYDFDLAVFYEKIANDMADAQAKDGLVPDIAPEYVVFEGPFRDSPEWGSAVVLDPWLAYQKYGDTGIIAAHYPGMKRYATYLASKASDNIIAYGLGDWYDIGPGEPGVSKLTSLGFTATAIYYQDLITLAECAKLLRQAADESGFRNSAAQVKDAFNKHFYTTETHVYDRGSQTAFAMALVTGLAPEADRPYLVEKLVADIRAHNNHVTAGDVGFHYVVSALTDNGRSDVLADMLSRTDAPSYGYQLKVGATTLTEAWDANPLSSQNHFMLGHAEEWFYRGLAGIDFDLSRPLGQQLIIKPSPVDGVTSASASYNSVVGKITSRWTITGGVFNLTVDVPANLRATIQPPFGKPFRVGSGHYSFRASKAEGITEIPQN